MGVGSRCTSRRSYFYSFRIIISVAADHQTWLISSFYLNQIRFLTEINVFAFHTFIPSNAVVTLMHNVNIKIRKLLVPGMVLVLDVAKKG